MIILLAVAVAMLTPSPVQAQADPENDEVWQHFVQMSEAEADGKAQLAGQYAAALANVDFTKYEFTHYEARELRAGIAEVLVSAGRVDHAADLLQAVSIGDRYAYDRAKNREGTAFYRQALIDRVLRLVELEDLRNNGDGVIEALRTAYDLKLEQYGQKHADIDPVYEKLSIHIYRRAVFYFDSGDREYGLNEIGRLYELSASYGSALPPQIVGKPALKLNQIAASDFETGRSDDAIVWLNSATDTINSAQAPKSDIEVVRNKLLEYMKLRADYYESVGNFARAEQDRRVIQAQGMVFSANHLAENLIQQSTRLFEQGAFRAAYEKARLPVSIEDKVDIPVLDRLHSRRNRAYRAWKKLPPDAPVPPSLRITRRTVVVQQASPGTGLIYTAPERVADDGSRKFTDVLTFFGTNRKRINETYSGENSERIEYGWAHITVPNEREPGSIKQPEAREQPKEELHFILQRKKTVPSSKIFNDLLNDSLTCTFYDFSSPGEPNCLQHAKTKPKELLLFVHGHNVAFKDAALRTAQLSVDLDISTGVFYAWPTGAHAAAYSTSRTNADKSYPYLRTFLYDVIKNSDADSIHVVAHSMGNRILLKALKEIQQVPPGPFPLFDQVIFASPDVDQLEFADTARTIAPMTQGMTLYASDKDKALWISSIFPKNKRRAGLAPPAPEIIYASNKLDYIDTSKLDRSKFEADFIAHADFTAGAFKDVRELVWKKTDPDNRCVLSRSKRKRWGQILKYWTTDPKHATCKMGTFGDGWKKIREASYQRNPPLVLYKIIQPARVEER